jgi:hypothetical protein
VLSVVFVGVTWVPPGGAALAIPPMSRNTPPTATAAKKAPAACPRKDLLLPTMAEIRTVAIRPPQAQTRESPAIAPFPSLTHQFFGSL